MNQLNFLEELARITPVLRSNQECEIYVFGIGAFWKHIHEQYKNVANIDLTDFIYAFVDNDPKKQGTVFMGKHVIPPTELKPENSIVLVAAEQCYDEIIRQLNRLGFIYYHNLFQPSSLTLILMRFVFEETRKFNKSASGRCFIIGNGPSLNSNDLNSIHKSQLPSFASNRIYNVFEKTAWRPTYYFAGDKTVVGDSVSFDIIRGMDAIKFLDIHLARSEYNSKNTYYFTADGTSYCYHYPYNMKFSTEIEHLYHGCTITYLAIQAAVSMGYEEIYILGVDNTFATEIMHDGTIVNREISTHFYSEGNAFPLLKDGVMAAYKYAQEFCSKHGVKIYNATRGGALEVFERINFDDLF
jgi:hypothetical protein